MKKFDASIARKMYWSNEIAEKTVCPECGSKLESEYHTYVIMVKTPKQEIESLMAGNDDGYFCHECPVVVLDYEKFKDVSFIGASSEPSCFRVAGIVDLDAIEEDKRHLPLGEDDNPIPLVEFIDCPSQNNNKQIHEQLVEKQKNIDCLTDFIREENLDPTSLRIAIECQEEKGAIFSSIDRFVIKLYDENFLYSWHVDSINDLFRGNQQPPSDIEMQRYPEKYIPFFHLVESNALFACERTKDITDEEFVEVYTTMRKRPDGKSLGFVHDVLWQTAAFALALNPYSLQEYEKIFAQLARSARHWKTGYSSRNYIQYLRKHF